LAVWACAQRTSQWQRHHRYLPESNRHPAKMLPALARHAIDAYSDPGDLIVDSMCGIGTTLVEAIHLDRRAVGVELEIRWATLATANVQQRTPARRERHRTGHPR
jgi:modification methylase